MFSLCVCDLQSNFVAVGAPRASSAAGAVHMYYEAARVGGWAFHSTIGPTTDFVGDVADGDEFGREGGCRFLFHLICDGVVFAR